MRLLCLCLHFGLRGLGLGLLLRWWVRLFLFLLLDICGKWERGVDDWRECRTVARSSVGTPVVVGTLTSTTEFALSVHVGTRLLDVSVVAIWLVPLGLGVVLCGGPSEGADVGGGSRGTFDLDGETGRPMATGVDNLAAWLPANGCDEGWMFDGPDLNYAIGDAGNVHVPL